MELLLQITSSLKAADIVEVAHRPIAAQHLPAPAGEMVPLPLSEWDLKQKLCSSCAEITIGLVLAVRFL